jgi:hypothetical protein
LLLALLRGLEYALLGKLRRRLQLLDDRVGPGIDAARIIVLAEARQDLVLDDQARKRVRHDRLESIADLDPNLAVAFGHEQDHAVVGALLPQSPGASEAVAIFLDRISLQLRHRRHHQLPATRLLKGLKLLRKRALVRWRKQIRLIDHPPAELRELLGVGGHPRNHAEQKQEPGEDHPAPLDYWPFPKSTLGACSAFCVVASKGTIGSAP